MATVDLNIEENVRDLEIDQADYGGDTTLSVNVGMFGSLSRLNITNSTDSPDELELKLVNESQMNFQSSPAVLELTDGANVTLSGMSGQDLDGREGMIIQVFENSMLRFPPEMASTAPQNLDIRVYTNSKFIYDTTGVTFDQSNPAFRLHLQPGAELQVVGANSYEYADGTLSFKDSQGQTVGQFDAPWIGGFKFDLEGDTLVVACYLKGTHIATPTGEVKIETLKAGDKVLTASGGVATIKWIGYRTLFKNRIREKDAKRSFPVLFKKGCIAANVPHRDLIMSPGHHVSFDGNLVSAMNLVNGQSIIQLFDMPSFQYFHIELEQFDILLAEGVPAESYVDTGNRNMFQNAHEVAMNPDFGPATGRPNIAGITLVRKGPVLEAIRAKLLERADWMQVPAETKYVA